MHVRDVERRLQGLRGGRDVHGYALDLVLPPVDPFRGDHKEPHGGNEQDRGNQGKADRKPPPHRYHRPRWPKPAALGGKLASPLRLTQPQPLAPSAVTA